MFIFFSRPTTTTSPARRSFATYCSGKECCWISTTHQWYCVNIYNMSHLANMNRHYNQTNKLCDKLRLTVMNTTNWARRWQLDIYKYILSTSVLIYVTAMISQNWGLWNINEPDDNMLSDLNSIHSVVCYYFAVTLACDCYHCFI